jgi:hypothetical protein
MPPATQHTRSTQASAQRTRRSRATRACRSENGQALVEFTLILPIILIILFAIAYFGLALNDWIDETQLASEGARFAAVNESCIVKEAPKRCEGAPQEEAAFLAWLTKQGDNAQVRGAKATICSNTSTNEGYVQVKLTYNYEWLPILHVGPSTPLTSTAQMKIEEQPATHYPACS